jgi:hypothetical protein
MSRASLIDLYNLNTSNEGMDTSTRPDAAKILNRLIKRTARGMAVAIYFVVPSYLLT